ncbi:prephenate dehydrogenase (NADP(+)) [Umbelopsis sp. WA50703]
MSNHSASIEQQKEEIELGIIGMGDMGRMYANRLSQHGWKRISVCDLPSNYEKLKEEFKDTPINVLRDGYHVSRRADWIMYAVEAEHIDRVVAQYGPATKIGSIVSGQTSVKQPEIEAFERHLPSDVHIISCHSMHGPNVNPKGQPLVMIKHRASQEKFDMVRNILSGFESNMVELSYQDHDRITADTQAVTHAAFLSMGAAWKANNQFPWLIPHFVGGIENVKVNVALRIYSNKWHVYAGLAIMNPSARIQITQYAKSVADLFKLMIQEKEEEFRNRIREAGNFVFGSLDDDHVPILLDDRLLDEFSLSNVPNGSNREPNSHLSLLAMVDCWYTLKLNPYEHMVCQTPLFRLWMGITEYLFRKPEMLEDAIQAALHRKEIRSDDMEFVTCARGWAECVELGSMEGYRKRFESNADFFKDRFADSAVLGNKMIAMISKNIQKS